MSRIGNSVIVIPADVTLSQQDGMVVVKGKNGELCAPLHSEVELNIADNIAKKQCWIRVLSNCPRLYYDRISYFRNRLERPTNATGLLVQRKHRTVLAAYVNSTTGQSRL